MKALFLAWQDSGSRKWMPVARLRLLKSGDFEFVYTKGALRAMETGNFVPFGRMKDLHVSYRSAELFPLFANRLLPKSRPEYRDYLHWLGLNEWEHSELEVLARTGGERATDSLQVFPCPEPDERGNFSAYFFSHGIRYLPSETISYISRQLQAGDPLYLLSDFQNASDPMALLMRTGDPIWLVGYCPRYYSSEFRGILERVGGQNVRVRVEQVNPEAPSQFRLLCKLECPWPKEFSPFSEGEFAPLCGERPDVPATA